MRTFIEEMRDLKSEDRYQMFCRVFGLSRNELENLLSFGLVSLDATHESVLTQWERMASLGFETFVTDVLRSLSQTHPPATPTRVSVFMMDEYDNFGREKLGGVSAFTDWDGEMVFIVYPDETSRRFLHSTIVHEYSHHLRIQALGLSEQNVSLLDKIILEGLAEHFVSHYLGEEFLGPWVKVLPSDAAWSVWRTHYTDRTGDTGPDTNAYLFGSKELGLPLWAGYSIGYHLVVWYREKNPVASIEELTIMDSATFIPEMPR